MAGLRGPPQNERPAPAAVADEPAEGDKPGMRLLDQADRRGVREDVTVTGRTGALALSPEDEAFLRSKAELRGMVERAGN